MTGPDSQKLAAAYRNHPIGVSSQTYLSALISHIFFGSNHSIDWNTVKKHTANFVSALTFKPPQNYYTKAQR